MEFRFRGKRKDNGEWIHGDKYSSQVFKNGESCVDVTLIRDDCHEDYEVHPDSVDMWTGLKDKNGVDAYGHDIVQTYYDDGDKGDIGYLECTNLGSIRVVIKERSTPIPLCFYSSWEIVGNVHQNKELLGE